MGEKKDYRETLYTVDERGRRKWVYTSLIDGFYLRRRKIVAYSLLAFYLAMPWISIQGKQGILLDIPKRRFLFFGIEFWATDFFTFFLVLGLMAFSLFFFTALLGRVWCGWACPETVFLEFLFRPVERWIEGGPVQRKRLDEGPWNFEKIRKKLLKHSLCAFFAWIIASTAVAYFIGREPLLEMMSDWPHKNPQPFLMTLVMMGLMAFQFGWFREQFCTVLCPYARFQSVLMDSNSVVVGYDVVRGEPRTKKRKGEDAESAGDCVDCSLCVRVCPTGIDIRNGLQLECIACTACVDACDSVMKKVGRPQGLIRYDTENRLLGRTKEFAVLRARPILYGLLVLGFLGALVFSIATRELSEFQIIRGDLDKPYTTLQDGRVSNHLHARVSNKAEKKDLYRFTLEGNKNIELLVPITPFPVDGGEVQTAPLFFNFSPEELTEGRLKVKVSITSENGFSSTEEVTLVGPEGNTP